MLIQGQWDNEGSHFLSVSQASFPAEIHENTIELYYPKLHKKKVNEIGKSLKSEKKLGVLRNVLSFIFNCCPGDDSVTWTSHFLKVPGDSNFKTRG